MKQQLARKALSTIHDMEHRFTKVVELEGKAPAGEELEGQRPKPVFFRYVCAIDDTGNFTDANGAHNLRFHIDEAEPYRIRSIMVNELSAYKCLDAAKMFPALDRPLPDGVTKRYASCDLLEILRGFFDYVKTSPA